MSWAGFLARIIHERGAQKLALLQKRLRQTELTMISDRGTFAAGHLLRLSDAGYDALAAAPWNDFRGLFDQQRKKLKWKQASYRSLEQQRRRKQGNLPRGVRHITPRSSGSAVFFGRLSHFQHSREK